jgi:uncharacterized damage-inducible protein DinB
MAENRDELLEFYRTARAELLAAIDGLSEAHMTEPTLDGWSVTDHLAHIAIWDEIRASEVERISAGHQSVWRMTVEQETAFSPMAYELRRGLSVAQAMWELETSRQRLLDAIASASDAGLDGSRYGEAGLRSSHEGEHTGWIARWRGTAAQ